MQHLTTPAERIAARIAAPRPMADPVFTSTRQALHVSFMFEVLPATQKSQMQMVLERMLEQAGIAEELEPHERTIDFQGLTALEVRGQCAMVVAAVGSKCTAPEIAALWTRFGMRRRQADGVRELAEYVGPMLVTTNRSSVLALIWGRYAREGRRDDFSLRKIASEIGGNLTTMARDQQRIATYQRALEGRAIDRLDDYFKSSSLVVS